MKTPLRFQVTECDCGTVSLLNALSYLFEREEIPAELVRAIHVYTLDCYDEKGNIGHGTSREAINKLTHWITRFANENDFKIKCERLEKEAVTLPKMLACLESNGCIFVRCWQNVEHYVIVTKIKRKYVYIFDPYYFNEKYYDEAKNVKIIFNRPFTHNRRVTLTRFLSESKLDFALGPITGRECVLITKKEA